MPVRRYGIYLAYHPDVSFQTDGLGRHLAMFLKGAHELGDVHFTIVCPSWTRDALKALFTSEQVPSSAYSIVAPERSPYILAFPGVLKSYRARATRRQWSHRLTDGAVRLIDRLWLRVARRAVTAHNAATVAHLLAEGIVVLVPLLLVALAVIPVVMVWWTWRLLRRLMARVKPASSRGVLARAASRLARPRGETSARLLTEHMLQQETERMHRLIGTLPGIVGWSCPAAFWPTFHAIQAPRLLCVPDVVLSDFPVGFAMAADDRLLDSFESVNQTVRNGAHFATYSHTVKWHTLVDKYHVPATNVTVIPHAPNRLDQLIQVRDLPDVAAASRHYCQSLLRSALERAGVSSPYAATFQNNDVRFLFFASQFRPNKNILTLLRAYEHLLRTRYVGHKLILTGRPDIMPNIAQFVTERRLEHDVLFLHGLSLSELAACYHLADLSVNPSLAEGGCPFTFTESLSVGTPVVMSRIPVTEEVLTDPTLRELSLFDPYDWQDCAARIEWALAHRDDLLAIQRPTYEQLCRRRWSHVVREHVDVIDRIAAEQQACL